MPNPAIRKLTHLSQDYKRHFPDHDKFALIHDVLARHFKLTTNASAVLRKMLPPLVGTLLAYDELKMMHPFQRYYATKLGVQLGLTTTQITTALRELSNKTILLDNQSRFFLPNTPNIYAINEEILDYALRATGLDKPTTAQKAQAAGLRLIDGSKNQSKHP